MNWKEFKDWMERQGVKDDDEMYFIDTHPNDFDMSAKKDERMGWQIT